MAGIPFITSLEFDYGTARKVTPLIRRVVAENPSAFTFKGTGTTIIGKGKVAIVDPGPDLPEHIEAQLRAVRGETVTHILVTHTHSDHSPATPAIARATGAKVYAFGPHPRPPSGVHVEQSGDLDFKPDVTLADGDVISGEGWTVEAIHTPGHISNHLCFAVREDQALLSGDHVMGWSTTVVSPPDGNMADYFASLRKLLPRSETVYIPTHGAEIRDPVPFVSAYIEHRLNREAQILARLKEGPKTIPEIVAINYAATPQHLHAAAGRSTLAHLIQMVKDGRVRTEDGAARLDSLYRL
ncbi:MAG: MBL fold metallo-hydrolase [Alphaproteobacteria bacterium]|nr:MBL fold metallo-hydrolase [Alphaproteobacteria bacterium]